VIAVVARAASTAGANGGGLAPPITEQARDVDGLWDVYLWISFGVLALIAVLMLYVVLRFRRRDDRLPRQKHYNIPMEVFYTVVRVAAGDDDAEVDLVVDVTAFQWQWQFQYPDHGVTIVGGAGDDVPELVLPAGSTVRFRLASLDVIHSFWITAFRFKRDVIPGEVTDFTVSIDDDAAGDYPEAGVCAEYCGLDHARMRFDLRVLEPDEFDAWLTERSLDATTPSASGSISEEATP
jgi:cytochrome c oxidase subunit 2